MANIRYKVWRFLHWMLQDKKCYYCGRNVRLSPAGTSSCKYDAATLDHLIPKSRGGPTSFLNAVVACRRCNEKKSARRPEELRWLAGRNSNAVGRHVV